MEEHRLWPCRLQLDHQLKLVQLWIANKKLPHAFLSPVSHCVSSQGAAEPTVWGGRAEGAPTGLVFRLICELFQLITLLYIGNACGGSDRKVQLRKQNRQLNLPTAASC